MFKYGVIKVSSESGIICYNAHTKLRDDRALSEFFKSNSKAKFIF